MNLLHLNILAAVTTVFTLSGCTTGNSGVTFGDFRDRASSLAGSGAQPASPSPCVVVYTDYFSMVILLVAEALLTERYQSSSA